MTTLATTLQLFFSDRLIRQRQVSPNTLQAYRDTLRLLLVFASERYSKVPAKLDIDDLDSPLIGAFLDHLERDRKNSVRTRNARLAAIRSLFRYAALRHPEHAATIDRVLAIPPKRFERRLVTYLSEGESQGPTGHAKSGNLDRAARHGPVQPRGPDWTSSIRTHRTALQRCASWRRRTCGL
jgi:Site-specific recombinase XerD